MFALFSFYFAWFLHPIPVIGYFRGPEIKRLVEYLFDVPV